jgi:hypothetical protein
MPRNPTRLLHEAAQLIDEACLERAYGRCHNATDFALQAIHLLHRAPVELIAPGTEGWRLLQEAILLRDSVPLRA